tara:strand:- start:77 stop:343 length:267 start_codon:yes stop_codon:yes gene_type:complete
MSDEFSIDIDKALENAKNTDHIGFDNPKSTALESVKAAVTNCIDLAGLDKKLMSNIADGEWTHHTTYNSMGRQSKKIVIEYDITEKSK